MAKNKITTIEGLAELINETMASKEDIKDVREDIAKVNGRLDRIEHLLIEEQRRKIAHSIGFSGGVRHRSSKAS